MVDDCILLQPREYETEKRMASQSLMVLLGREIPDMLHSPLMHALRAPFLVPRPRQEHGFKMYWLGDASVGCGQLGWAGCQVPGIHFTDPIPQNGI